MTGHCCMNAWPLSDDSRYNILQRKRIISSSSWIIKSFYLKHFFTTEKKSDASPKKTIIFGFNFYVQGSKVLSMCHTTGFCGMTLFSRLAFHGPAYWSATEQSLSSHWSASDQSLSSHWPVTEQPLTSLQTTIELPYNGHWSIPKNGLIPNPCFSLTSTCFLWNTFQPTDILYNRLFWKFSWNPSYGSLTVFFWPRKAGVLGIRFVRWLVCRYQQELINIFIKKCLSIAGIRCEWPLHYSSRIAWIP